MVTFNVAVNCAIALRPMLLSSAEVIHQPMPVSPRENADPSQWSETPLLPTAHASRAPVPTIFQSAVEKDGRFLMVEEMIDGALSPVGKPMGPNARFGYPLVNIQQEGLLTPMGELLHKLADGSLSRLRARSGFQVGVRVVVPPFPYADRETFESTSKGSAILFKTPSREGVHIEEVKLEGGEWRVAGASGVALVVCGALALLICRRRRPS